MALQTQSREQSWGGFCFNAKLQVEKTNATTSHFKRQSAIFWGCFHGPGGEGGPRRSVSRAFGILPFLFETSNFREESSRACCCDLLQSSHCQKVLLSGYCDFQWLWWNCFVLIPSTLRVKGRCLTFSLKESVRSLKQYVRLLKVKRYNSSTFLYCFCFSGLKQALLLGFARLLLVFTQTHTKQIHFFQQSH